MAEGSTTQDLLDEEATIAANVLALDVRLRSWHRNFLVMSICFGLTHATATASVAYASSVFGTRIGNLSNATLYLGCVLSALMLGPVVDSRLGPKWGLMIGMIGDVIYLVCFSIAAAFASDTSSQWVLAILGSLLGGCGAGLMWTCQGSYFSIVTDRIVEICEMPRDVVSTQLSSIFAFYFLGQECFWNVVIAVLLENAKVDETVAFLIFAALGASGTLILTSTRDISQHRLHARGSLCLEASAALKLWPDPKLWLISFTTIAFGFSSSWINGYVNGHWVPQAIGSRHVIGYLSAITAGTAAISSTIYAKISECVGSKSVVLLFGSIAFCCIATMSLLPMVGGEDPGRWHFAILAFPVCMGLGRGSYEGVNRSIFADFFLGEKAVGAFANVMVQGTLASAIGFVLGAASYNTIQILLIVVISVLICPCHFAAMATMRTQIGQFRS